MVRVEYRRLVRLEVDGSGGVGTGATLNSYANGIDGGSGIVIIKYYTNSN